jgi:hypothetical protein
MDFKYFFVIFLFVWSLQTLAVSAELIESDKAAFLQFSRCAQELKTVNLVFSTAFVPLPVMFIYNDVSTPCLAQLRRSWKLPADLE